VASRGGAALDIPTVGQTLLGQRPDGEDDGDEKHHRGDSAAKVGGS
jgi:hypothetical protein